MAQSDDGNVLVHRQVNISCPSGKHRRSLVTFRNHAVAVMFCLPCEQAWTEPTSHPEIQALPIDRTMRG
jgi:hypothetical protein